MDAPLFRTGVKAVGRHRINTRPRSHQEGYWDINCGDNIILSAHLSALTHCDPLVGASLSLVNIYGSYTPVPGRNKLRAPGRWWRYSLEGHFVPQIGSFFTLTWWHQKHKRAAARDGKIGGARLNQSLIQFMAFIARAEPNCYKRAPNAKTICAHSVLIDWRDKLCPPRHWRNSHSYFWFSSCV